MITKIYNTHELGQFFLAHCPVGLECLRREDGYSFWYELRIPNKKQWLIFPIKVATIWPDEVNVRQTQYLGEISDVIRSYESMTQKVVTLSYSEKT